MEKLYTVSKTRPGADCGSDHELLIAKFRIKLKKVGETIRPLRYDLNQIPYDYIVEATNIFSFFGSKITADGDCSHEIKRRLLLGRKVMTNLDSTFKSRDITLPTKKGLSSQGYGFSSGHVWI